MWKDLPKLKNPASFLPWLRQIARNRAHHVLRSRVRARRHESADEVLVQTVAEARPGAETAFLAEEDRRLVADALDRLPDDSREVLLLVLPRGTVGTAGRDAARLERGRGQAAAVAGTRGAAE
jgi:RNA polymerase sigma factor (sigma-70 family)